MFELTDKPIDIVPVVSNNPQAGGFVSFEGRVRDINEGRGVTRLEYEVYTALAITEGNEIISEALQKFGLFHAYAIHRFGTLLVGETAIWIHASAMHRHEAFEGAEFIIHSIKHRLPIWKKEWYEDGASGWVNCKHNTSL